MYKSKLIAILIFVLFGGFGLTYGQERDSVPVHLELENAIANAAEDLLRQLHKEGVKNVGVFKFAVAETGMSKLPFSLGRINMRLAEKTELALVWRNSAATDGADPGIGVVKSASEIGKELLALGKAASHVDPKTRSQFFAFERPLYWEHDGQKVAKPDAFVFGFAELHRKSRTMSLSLIHI